MAGMSVDVTRGWTDIKKMIGSDEIMNSLNANDNLHNL